MQRHWIVIGNPENRRVTFFQDALKHADQSPATIVSYQQFSTRHFDDLYLTPYTLTNQLRDRSTPCIVRIESPGENFRTTQMMLSLGSELAEEEGSPFISQEEVFRLNEETGEVLYPRQWYLGFQDFLQTIESRVEPLGTARFMNSPSEIATMFDKRQCSEMFRERGIPTPDSLGVIQSYDQLIERMNEMDIRRVFVKLAHGSSASGVVAFELAGGRQRAITTAELVRDSTGLRVFNSLKIRTYTDLDQIRDLINWICSHRAVVERWIPKARIDGRNFDCRFVVIGGTCQHFVVRSSQTPLTNLHLNSQRSERLPEDCGARLADVAEVCQRAMSLFPHSTYAGVDICIDRRTGLPYVLEVNAFGDLLPSIICDGETTYEAEIRTLMTGKLNTPLTTPPKPDATPTALLVGRFHLCGLNWFSEMLSEIHQRPSELVPDPEEAGLILSTFSGEGPQSHFVYADWLEERGCALAAFAQRLAARGAHWKNTTPSTAGLMLGGRCYGVAMRTGSGYRCWRNTSESEQEYMGVANSFETVAVQIYEGLMGWLSTE